MLNAMDLAQYIACMSLRKHVCECVYVCVCIYVRVCVRADFWYIKPQDIYSTTITEFNMDVVLCLLSIISLSFYSRLWYNIYIYTYNRL